jgi:hypothetical protein
MSIELKINNIALPLPRGIKMNREMETTIFNKEDTVYDFSYPIEIPLTANARIALGFPDVLSISNRNQVYNGTLIIDGIFVSEVSIALLGVNKKSETCRISIIGQYADLAKEFGSKRVNDIEIGGVRFLPYSAVGIEDIEYTFPNIEDGAYDYGELRLTYKGGEVNNAITRIAKGIVVEDFLFPKAIDLGGNLPGLDDGIAVINAWDTAKDRYVDADLYNAMAMEYEYMPSVVPANPFANNQRHFWVPMFKIKNVLVEIFDEQGLSLEADILSDAAFAKLVLYNTHAINVGWSGGWDDAVPRFNMVAGANTAYVYPRQHLPNMSINTFLRELAKRFNWQFQYDRLNKKVTIKEDRKLTEYPDAIIDLSKVADPKPTINYEKSDTFLNGYKFSFEDDPNNPAQNENVQNDLSLYNNRGAINTIAGIGGISSPVIDDYVFVKSENAYYKYVGGEGFVLYSHNIGGYSTTDNGESLLDITTKCVSPPMMLQSVKMINYYPAYASVFTLIGDYYDNENEIVPFSKIGMTYNTFNYIDFGNENGILYSPGIGHPWAAHTFQDNKRVPIDHLPTIISYVGYIDGVSGSIKYYGATTGAYTNNGAAAYSNNYSGAWDIPGGYGLYPNWWASFVAQIIGSISTEWVVLIDAATYTKMDLNNVVFVIDGLRYVAKKANIVMGFPDLATLQLVKVL